MNVIICAVDQISCYEVVISRTLRVWSCDVWEGMKNSCKCSSKNLKLRGHLGKLGVDSR